MALVASQVELAAQLQLLDDGQCLRPRPCIRYIAAWLASVVACWLPASPGRVRAPAALDAIAALPQLSLPQDYSATVARIRSKMAALSVKLGTVEQRVSRLKVRAMQAGIA